VQPGWTRTNRALALAAGTQRARSELHFPHRSARPDHAQRASHGRTPRRLPRVQARHPPRAGQSRHRPRSDPRLLPTDSRNPTPASSSEGEGARQIAALIYAKEPVETLGHASDPGETVDEHRSEALAEKIRSRRLPGVAKPVGSATPSQASLGTLRGAVFASNNPVAQLKVAKPRRSGVSRLVETSLGPVGGGAGLAYMRAAICLAP